MRHYFGYFGALVTAYITDRRLCLQNYRDKTPTKNREKPAFEKRKRKAMKAAAEKQATPESAPPSPPLSSVAPEVLSSSTCCSSSAQVPAPSTVERVEGSSSSNESLTHLHESLTHLPTKHDSTEKPTEERESLHMQFIHQEPLKNMSLTDVGESKKRPSTTEQGTGFVSGTNGHLGESDSMVSALQQLQAHCFVDECLSPDFINLMVRAHNTCNGMTNCIHHIPGSMVKNMVDKLRMDSNAKAIEELTNRIQTHSNRVDVNPVQLLLILTKNTQNAFLSYKIVCYARTLNYVRTLRTKIRRLTSTSHTNVYDENREI